MREKNADVYVIEKNRKTTTYGVKYTITGLMNLVEKAEQAKNDYLLDKATQLIAGISR